MLQCCGLLGRSQIRQFLGPTVCSRVTRPETTRSSKGLVGVAVVSPTRVCSSPIEAYWSALSTRYSTAVYSQQLCRQIRLEAKFFQPKLLACVAGNPRFAYTKMTAFDKEAHFDTDETHGHEPRDSNP